MPGSTYVGRFGTLGRHWQGNPCSDLVFSLSCLRICGGFQNFSGFSRIPIDDLVVVARIAVSLGRS